MSMQLLVLTAQAVECKYMLPYNKRQAVGYKTMKIELYFI